jgi:hypothetical protein
MCLSRYEKTRRISQNHTRNDRPFSFPMNSNSAKLFDKIDYNFRPESYWASPSDPLQALLRNVKGKRRREMIRDYYTAGKFDEVCSALLGDSLDEDIRKLLSYIHPTFMGGEYLPSYRRHEVEIARIELESTTSDVISLRASGSDKRIKYRLVDEYETEFNLPQQTSRRPFSLRELIFFLDAVKDCGANPDWHWFGFPLVYNEFNFLEGDADLETLRDFMRVDSDFYPELTLHYGRVINEWYSERKQLQNFGRQ